MSTADKFFQTFKDAFNAAPGVSVHEKQKALGVLEEAYRDEPLPTIAVIGEAGVGKSTTLNSLFNAGAAVGHSRPTTTTSDHFEVHVHDHNGNRGQIRVIDLPGLGESIERAEELNELYRRSLPRADVILWVHPIHDRMLEFTQRQIGRVFSGDTEGLIDRLVFGLNKADDIHPGDWRRHANIPSEAQFANLAGAANNFAETVSTVLPHRQLPRAVTYSALRRYQLPQLFRLLMDAMPDRRRWVLEQRMDLADFKELADPEFLTAVTGEQPTSRKPLPTREAIVATMSFEDLRNIALAGLSPEQWWTQARQ